jgi:hypothetical protein
MNVFALTQDRWIDYCKSPSPGIPHTGPMPLIVPLAICCFFTIFLLALLARHFHARKRPMTRVDFEDGIRAGHRSDTAVEDQQRRRIAWSVPQYLAEPARNHELCEQRCYPVRQHILFARQS